MNFIEDAIRTKSPNFYQEKLGKDALRKAMVKFEVAGEQLDDYKKLLYYGKGDPVVSSKSTFLDMKDQKQIDILHAILGIATESVELIQAILNADMDFNQIDDVNLMEEAGDIFWYLAILHDVMGIGFEQTQEKIINKLKTRFPDAYSDDLAKNRDLESERKVLEGS